MELQIKPICLLSDSALLFQKKESGLYCLHGLREQITTEDPSAVYIGASNGDVQDFYEIFQAGMQNIGIENCTHITASFTKKEQERLETADLILLSGGDPKIGWDIMQDKGMAEIIRQKHLDGTLLIGVSAGAIQLAWELILLEEHSPIPMLQFAPFLVDVHDEANDWKRLKLALKKAKTMKRGLGICTRSGLIYHPDQTIEILGKPAHEFIYKDGEILESLLWTNKK